MALKKARAGWSLWSVSSFLLLIASAVFAPNGSAKEGPALRFRVERAGFISIHLYRPEGSLLRPLLVGQRMPAGEHAVPWDGCDADGRPVPPGEYSWRGLFHEDEALKLLAAKAQDSAQFWPSGWGDGAGVPSAVAADAEQVYLGWSLDGTGKVVAACDLEGQPRWSYLRAEQPFGCRALAVDGGLIYVLGGSDGVGAVYRLEAKSGTPVPWPSGALDLQIPALWPPDLRAQPTTADGMAVRAGRLYLTFTTSEFLAVLDAKTGAYLQTVVGAPPGLIDVAPTQTDLPDAPGKLVDADFAVIALGGAVLGKVLFAHDPLWVITSELIPMRRDAQIAALTVLGDGAKQHRHTAFIGLGAPAHQVQARPLLDTEQLNWTAGQLGGRPLLGPWQRDALRDIRGVALAADGRLWVAEGDALPRRFSVWETKGEEGTLVREFFGSVSPMDPDAARHPVDANVLFARGCEWRLDPATRRIACLGVVTREPLALAAYGQRADGTWMLMTVDAAASEVRIFERRGDGDFRELPEAPARSGMRAWRGGKIIVPSK